MKSKKSPLKWAGSKYKLLSYILPLIGTPKRYCEPFGGSLSVALNVDAQEYILNDINEDLYSFYTNVNKSFFIEARDFFLSDNNSREKYNEIKTTFNNSTNSKERALLFLYLNKHCFNGLSRYNSKGEFNVPYGRESKNPMTGKIKILKSNFPSDEILNFIQFIENNNVTFYNTTFSDLSLYSTLEKNDVVYFDPPYVPIDETSNFTQYSKDDFNYEQHVELVNLAKLLASKGIKVIISNHDTPITQELYKEAQLSYLQVQRNISANSSSRKKVGELLAIYQ